MIKKVMKFFKEHTLTVKDFLKKYWIVSAILIYLTIYLLFIIEGPFATGNGLDKGNWLTFLGEYLGITTTLIFASLTYSMSKKLNSLNEKVAQAELADRMPIIMNSVEQVYKPLGTFPQEVQEAFIRQGSDINRPIIALEKYTPQIFIIYNAMEGQFKYLSGLAEYIEEFAHANQQNNCTELIKIFKLKNVTDEPIFDVVLFCNDKKVTPAFHLPAKETFEAIFVLTEKINMKFKLTFCSKRDQKYYQTFTYDVLNNSGVWYGETISKPQIEGENTSS